jgi:hypothetical protein
MKVPRLKTNTPKIHPINNIIATKYNKSLMVIYLNSTTANGKSVPISVTIIQGLFAINFDLLLKNGPTNMLHICHTFCLTFPS